MDIFERLGRLPDQHDLEQVTELLREEPLALLEPEEGARLITGFLRARELAGADFSSVESDATVFWAQQTRSDEAALDLVARHLGSIDVQDLEIVFMAPRFNAGDLDAAEGMIAEEEPELRAVLVALCATRWAAGQFTSNEDIARVARWVRMARSRAILLDAFLACPGAAIDFDARGRIAIYPPDGLE